MLSMSSPGSPIPPPLVSVEQDRPCVRCSYNLKGLPTTGSCPECGTPIQDSLRGILLHFASPEYLKSMRTGLSLVLNGILLMIVVMVASIFMGLVASMYATGSGVRLLISLASMAPSIMILVGYWLFTEPDPGFAGLERPDSARKVIRATVAVQAVFQAFHAVFVMLGVNASFNLRLGARAVVTPVDLLAILLGLASLIAWAVQFFAVMLYTRWLAARIPDRYVLGRSKTYMWVLPLLQTVGVVLVGLGPLIALVMYWNLLDRVRKHLKSIATDGKPLRLEGV